MIEELAQYSVELTEPIKLSEQMKDGLAHMYGNKGAVDYLENSVKVLNKNMIKALDDNQVELAKRYANKIEAILQILANARMCYNSYKSKHANNEKG